MDLAIKNKVAESGIVVINLSDYIPRAELTEFDIKKFLFKGLILREKDFREQLENENWQAFTNKYVNIICSTDAVIPMWAYMLVVKYLHPITQHIFVGNTAEMKRQIILIALNNLDVSNYSGKSIIIKGCGDENIGADAYAIITQKLLPVAKTIMYGEPCSTVPIFKRKN